MGGARALGGALDPDPMVPAPIPEEELSRAGIYGLLARLMAAPPDARTLNSLAQLAGDGEGEIGAALGHLARAAAKATPETAGREYHDLFIGIGRGEFVPFGSFYMTGFLHEKPLADLRRALGELGIERAAGVKEPEDHIAALCEAMGGLITGAFGPQPAPLAEQQKFFDAFIAPWAARFFADLEQAKAAGFYAGVGRLGRLFLGVEQTAFAIA